MSTPTTYSEYYRKISNSELIHILENPLEYQPEAVEAAKLEFSIRQLSKSEIEIASEPLIAAQVKKEYQAEKIRTFESRINNGARMLVNTLNPIQNETPSIEKTIRLIVFIFSADFLFQVPTKFQSLKEYAVDYPRSPLLSSASLVLFIIQPIGIFTFWKKRMIGWILLTIFSVYSFTAGLWMLFNSLTIRLSGKFFHFQQPSAAAYFIYLFFFAGIIYILCKRNMREIFLISKPKMLNTIAITAVISFFLVMAIS
jgi:hypothetical protein